MSALWGSVTGEAPGDPRNGDCAWKEGGRESFDLRDVPCDVRDYATPSLPTSSSAFTVNVSHSSLITDLGYLNKKRGGALDMTRGHEREVIPAWVLVFLIEP